MWYIKHASGWFYGNFEKESDGCFNTMKAKDAFTFESKSDAETKIYELCHKYGYWEELMDSVFIPAIF